MVRRFLIHKMHNLNRLETVYLKLSDIVESKNCQSDNAASKATGVQ